MAGDRASKPTRRTFANWLLGTSAVGYVAAVIYPIGRYLTPPPAAESATSSVVLPFPVTGGSISDGAGRLDFDVDGDLPVKETIEEKLNALVAADHPVSDEWISDEELLANPDLVKTMKVQPPMGTGRVRLVRIGDIDLQPCGGTHVRSTSEIGRLALGKIESKGRQNRRVRIAFAEHS